MTEQAVLRVVSHSTAAGPAAQELAVQLAGQDLSLVLFFCSAQYDLDALAQALQQAFGEVCVVGCTTAGEITPGGYGRNCITALGFSREHFAAASVLVDQMERFTLLDAQELADGLLQDCRRRALAPIKGHSFALTLLDGLSSREEVVLAALSTALGGIPHFGGSAGDDNNLNQTHVYHQGRFYSGAAVLVLLNTPLDFEVFTTHHLQPATEKLVITKADPETRRVLELNAEPAATAYARLTRTKPADMDLYHFARHPLAVRVGEHYYPRAIQKANADDSLTFYCAVENGIVLTQMQRTPLKANLQRLFAGLKERLGPLELVVGCDCFFRRMEAESEGTDAVVEDILRRQKVIGFNTYGEQYNGMHINQTFTGVAIGQPRPHR